MNLAVGRLNCELNFEGLQPQPGVTGNLCLCFIHDCMMSGCITDILYD